MPSEKPKPSWNVATVNALIDAAIDADAAGKDWWVSSIPARAESLSGRTGVWSPTPAVPGDHWLVVQVAHWIETEGRGYVRAIASKPTAVLLNQIKEQVLAHLCKAYRNHSDDHIGDPTDFCRRMCVNYQRVVHAFTVDKKHFDVLVEFNAETGVITISARMA